MRIIFLIFFAIATLFSIAQIPAGYYNPAQGLSGTPLRTALHNIIDDHTVIDYDDLYSAFESTDKKSNGKVWDMYSDIPGVTPPYEYSFTSADQCGNYGGEGDCYNREHSWPKSWFGCEQCSEYSDLFHLYPTDGYVNNQRGNLPFGEVGTATWTSLNGSKYGPSNYPGWTGVTVFEPIDGYKGDFARTYFYMTTRYYTEDASWPSNQNSMVNKCEIKPVPMQMLLSWHHSDPVSQKEINRNNAVYGIQHNRNPFIDHPEYADLIWDPDYSATSATEISLTTVFPNPATERLYIVPPQSYPNLQLCIYNTTGELVFENQFTNETIIQLDVSGYKQGCYIIRLDNNNEINYFKVILF